MADGQPQSSGFVARCIGAIFTYRTTKMVRVYDGQLVTFFQFFTVLGYIYGIFLVIVRRGYQTFTVPTMSVVISTQETNVTAPAYVQTQLLLNYPSYCNSSLTYYNYSVPTRVYDNVQCIGYLKVPEYTAYDASQLWVYTFFQQRTWNRVCVGGEGSSEGVNGSYPFVITFPSNCTANIISKGNAFVYLVENTQVTIRPWLHISGKAPSPINLLTVASKGAVRSDGSQLSSSTGLLTLQLSDIISAAGANLDVNNPNSGGYGPDDPYSGNRAFPPYRMTGMRIVGTLDVTNFHSTNPINFNVTGALRFDMMTRGSWNLAPRQIDDQGNPLGLASGGHLEDSTFTEKEYSGVEVVFVVTGVVGSFDIFALIQSFLNVFVVMVAIGSFVDAVAPYLSVTFARDKYDDEGERALLSEMLDKSADHGVPFNLDDLRIRLATGQLGESYEGAILRLEKEIEDVAAGKDRVRMAAKALAAELNLDGDAILDEKEDTPEPLMKLMTPDGLDEIPLYASDNVIGRGLGKVNHPTISRRQMIITVHKDTLKAFAKSLRPPKANSVPGVKRGEEWRQLTEKGQSINIGDAVCMQYKTKPTVEIMNEYLYVPLDQLPEQRPNLWTQLEKQIKTVTGL